MHKKVLLTTLSVALAGAGLWGVTQVSAQDTANSPHDSLINRLVTKFGLNETEVRQVFEEEHEARHAEMEKHMEERLTQAVADGKLTEEQKKTILAKHEEMENSREQFMGSFKNMTDEERKSAMNTRREELRTWAEEHDIPMEYLMFRGNGMRGGFHMNGMQ